MPDRDDLVAEVEVLHLRPGDVVVIKLDDDPPSDQLDRLAGDVRRALREQHPVLVLRKNDSVGVMRPA